MPTLLASQQRLLLRQSHAQQWLRFFATQQLTRTALFEQHRSELSVLLNRIVSRWEIASILRQQMLNIYECRLTNQHQRQCLKVQQDLEKQKLETALA